MEMKARQLNNRRSKTKSYSPACLRTVQIESKTRRGNRGAEAGNPPAPRPAAPASLRPSSPVFVSGLCNREGGRRAGARRPRGAEVRRRRSLAGRAAFIISRTVYFIFTSPRRGSGSNKRLLVSLSLARGALPRVARALERGGVGVGGRRGTRHTPRSSGCRRESGYLTLHPKGY